MNKGCRRLWVRCAGRHRRVAAWTGGSRCVGRCEGRAHASVYSAVLRLAALFQSRGSCMVTFKTRALSDGDDIRACMLVGNPRALCPLYCLEESVRSNRFGTACTMWPFDSQHVQQEDELRSGDAEPTQATKAFAGRGRNLDDNSKALTPDHSVFSEPALRSPLRGPLVTLLPAAV